jgi:hypothetical protein
MSLTKFELEFPWGELDTGVYCPVCGARTLGAEDVTECPHLLYVYLCDISEFVWIEPQLATAVQHAPENEQEDPPEDLATVEQYLETDNAQGLLEISRTTRGMACGPISSTVRVCFCFLGSFVPSTTPRGPNG